MSRAYIGTIEDLCPNATLVLDRFLIAKALNESVDGARKEENGERLLPMSVRLSKGFAGFCSGIPPIEPKKIPVSSMLYEKAIVGSIEHGF